MNSCSKIYINGHHLTLENIIQVAHNLTKIYLDNHAIAKINKSQHFIKSCLSQNKIIYGVNTNFGGMADHFINQENQALLQENLIWGLKCGTGNRLAKRHVRAGMLLRANALARGVSGIRCELVDRILHFLNADMIPIVFEYGSIGASGDLVPLAYVAGAILGLSESFKVEYQEKEIDALTALQILKLSPISLEPKEGLALVNGTSMMTGIAANAIHEAKRLFNLTLHIHAFYLQALCCSVDAFDPFVHLQKPHKGQLWVASFIKDLLHDSQFIHSAVNEINHSNGLVQNRYSIRCLPQYLGVIIDGINSISQQIEIEANSANDNPLIDADAGKIYHGGNFLGQYIGVGMDQLRYYLGLTAKHLDTQIALLVTPEFSHGLPSSLAGDHASSVRFGLKGLQICANSMMPLLLQLGQPIVPFFPTHAEQFNQNINSQGFSAANLAWQSIQLFTHYTAVALIFAIQAIELRTYIQYQHYDARPYISPALVALYEAIYQVTGSVNSSGRPFILHNYQQGIDQFIANLVNDLTQIDSKIMAALIAAPSNKIKRKLYEDEFSYHN